MTQLKRKILIVDDSASIRLSVCETLKGGGYDVMEAGDGAQALAEIMQQTGSDGGRIKLVVCDVNMPRMDGLTFVRLLRNLPEYKDLPVLIFTTDNTNDRKQEGVAAGATYWLVKPSNPVELLSTIGRYILQ